MRMVRSNKLKTTICVALLLLTSTSSAFAYPPDNAAVLYYQAFMVIERPDDDVLKMLDDVSEGKIKPNDDVKKIVERYRNVIDLVTEAANIANCDWGMDYSKGVDLIIPYLGHCRVLAWVTLADAQILTSKGDYKKALGRCLTVQKAGHHVSQGELLCYLTGTTMINMANKCVQSILANMPQDLKTLHWFKNQLVQIENRSYSFKTCVETELKKLRIYIRKETAEKAFDTDFYKWAKVKLPKPVADRAIEAPEEFFAENEKYWDNYTVRLKAALELPYADGYTCLTKLHKQIQQDANNPDTALTAFWTSNFPVAFHYHAKMLTFCNAIGTAVDIYIIKAKAEKLPDGLPAGLPKDLFSGKDFEYEKTDAGFILRCLGRDLLKDKIHQYEFKFEK